MQNQQPPKPTESDQTSSLEKMDELIKVEDPGFVQSLDAVRKVKIDSKLDIASTPVDESMMPAVSKDSLKFRFRHLKTRLRIRVGRTQIALKEKSKEFLQKTIIFLRTRPKEFAFYALVLIKELIRSLKEVLHSFKTTSRAQKLAVLALVVLAAGSFWVLRANFKGKWLPQLHEPEIGNLATVAEWVETYDPIKAQAAFYAAFPQERYEFLFNRFKVNLKRVPGYPNPMGAFEVIAVLDSEETAVEVRDREVELHDQLQRTIEEETFTSLESELGKKRLKSVIMRDINAKLTQGYVRDISFKTFVLKP